MDRLCLVIFIVLLSSTGSHALEIDLLSKFRDDPKAYNITPIMTAHGESFTMSGANKLQASRELLESTILNIESTREFFIYADVIGIGDGSSAGALFSIVHFVSRRNKKVLLEVVARGGSEKRAKLTLRYRLTNGSTHTLVFRRGILELLDGNYHTIALHLYDSGLQSTMVDLYIDCKLKGRKQTLTPVSLVFSYEGIRLSRMEFRIAQKRGLKDKVVASRWKGRIRVLKFIFKRTLKQVEDKFCKPKKPPFQPMISEYNIQTIMTDIKGLIRDLRYDFSVQVAEIKYLRKVVESCQMCRVRDFCKFKPCFPGVPCFNDPYSDQGFECGDCPLGMEGNGVNCTDIDECLLNPCGGDNNCHNRSPGYWCPPCPKGYKGKEVYGIGRKFASLNKQTCTDVDECQEGTALCSIHSQCINTLGGYQCSPCPPGYTGNPHIACIFLDYCNGDPKTNPCSSHADCIPLRGGRSYRCECNVNYAGDGIHCGHDRDHDGFPDTALNCTGEVCRADNCPLVSNRDQSDIDNDGRGDECDEDMDGDGIRNSLDNCVLVPNPTQLNNDGDVLGDDCDNCPYHSNSLQSDLDDDGEGDVCDKDMDGDGVFNRQDNCPKVYNPRQEDADKDGIGDECDNCPKIKNKSQRDVDGDSLGNECDKNIDQDQDGVDDSIDNCLGIPNVDQVDNDGDGKGDVCDYDDDNDGVPDIRDNCPFVPNKMQRDLNGDGRGDECQYDYDGDKIPDEIDVCPNNRDMFVTDFKRLQKIVLNPYEVPRTEPAWVVDKKGNTVRETVNSDPGIAIGQSRFNGVDFNGTLFVDTTHDDDYIGIIFSYLDNKRFYAMVWKQNDQVFWKMRPFRSTAIRGIQIKAIKSRTGPGPIMRNAMWHTGDVRNEVKMLWKDPANQGWKDKTKYFWQLTVRPTIGLIRLRVDTEKGMLIDTGNIWDNTLTGGRLGMYVFSQANVVWEDMRYACNETVPIYAQAEARKRKGTQAKKIL